MARDFASQASPVSLPSQNSGTQRLKKSVMKTSEGLGKALFQPLLCAVVVLGQGRETAGTPGTCNNSPVERLVSVLLVAQLGDQAGTAGRVVPKAGGLLLQLLSDTCS